MELVKKAHPDTSSVKEAHPYPPSPPKTDVEEIPLPLSLLPDFSTGEGDSCDAEDLPICG